MLRKIGEQAPPTGLKLKLFRAPLYFYRFKLGFLLGARFILLKHRGRKSGALRETVIEVIDQDATGEKIYSASGFGEQSQWFRNISADNSVLVTRGNREFAATARVLPQAEATGVLMRYAAANARSMKAVARLSGYEMDGSEQDVREFSQVIRIVEFTLAPPPE